MIGHIETATERVAIRFENFCTRAMRLPVLNAQERMFLRRAQADRYSSILPTILTGSLILGLTTTTLSLIHYQFWGTLVWGAVIVLLSAIGISRSRRLRARVADGYAPSDRFVKRLIVDSSVLSATWSQAGWALNPLVDYTFEPIVSTALAGVAAVGAYAMSIVPSSAVAFLAIMILGRATQIVFADHFMWFERSINLLILGLLASLIMAKTARYFIENVKRLSAINALNTEANDIAHTEVHRRQKMDEIMGEFTCDAEVLLKETMTSISEFRSASEKLLNISERARNTVDVSTGVIETFAGETTRLKDFSKLVGESLSLVRVEADQTTEAVGSVSRLIEESITVERELSKAIGQIAETARAMVLIAKQTKMLGLNATIESSRVDLDTRSFGIVANEMRHLASSAEELAEQVMGRMSVSSDVAQRTIENMKNIDVAAETVMAGARNIINQVSQQSAALDELQTYTARAIELQRSVLKSIDMLSDDAIGVDRESVAILSCAEVLEGAALRMNECIRSFLLRMKNVDQLPL